MERRRSSLTTVIQAREMKQNSLTIARYRWQKAADDFSEAYKDLWNTDDLCGDLDNRIYLVGDSIFQGNTFNRFERMIDLDPGPLAHVDRTFNLVAAASNISCRCVFSGVQGVSQLLKLCSKIGAQGNTIAFLDAGPRADSAEAVEAYFTSILGTVRSCGLHAIAFSNYTGVGAPPNCRYDVKLGTGETNANNCIRKATRKTGAHLLDLASLGHFWDNSLKSVGCTIMLPDGVHYNVLGCLLIACQLVRAVDPKSELSLDPVWKELNRLWPLVSKTSRLPASFPPALPDVLTETIMSLR